MIDYKKYFLFFVVLIAGCAAQSREPIDSQTSSFVTPYYFQPVDLACAYSEESIIPLILIEPRYPISAFKSGIDGVVKLRFLLDKKTFKPSSVEVVSSEPSGIFDKSAMNAIQSWVFKPCLSKNMAKWEKHYTLEIVYSHRQAK